MFGDPDAGTPEPELDGGEEAGTPEAQDGGEKGDDKVAISKGELGVWKSKAEQFNALKAENERLKAERESRTTTDNRGSEAEERRNQIAARADRIARLRIAAKTNEDAAVLVDTLEITQESEQRQLYRLEMSEVPKDERAEVQAFMRERGLSSPAIAHQMMRGGSRFETLAEENRRLRAEIEEAKKPKPKIEGTRIVGKSSATVTKKSDGVLSMNVQQYNDEMATPEGREKIRAARREGKFELKAR